MLETINNYRKLKTDLDDTRKEEFTSNEPIINKTYAIFYSEIQPHVWDKHRVTNVIMWIKSNVEIDLFKEFNTEILTTYDILYIFKKLGAKVLHIYDITCSDIRNMETNKNLDYENYVSLFKAVQNKHMGGNSVGGGYAKTNRKIKSKRLTKSRKTKKHT